MRRPGAERTEPKPIERDIERDQAVLRNLEHEVAAKRGAGGDAEGEEQKRAAASAILRPDICDQPVLSG